MVSDGQLRTRLRYSWLGHFKQRRKNKLCRRIGTIECHTHRIYELCEDRPSKFLLDQPWAFLVKACQRTTSLIQVVGLELRCFQTKIEDLRRIWQVFRFGKTIHESVWSRYFQRYKQNISRTPILQQWWVWNFWVNLAQECSRSILSLQTWGWVLLKHELSHRIHFDGLRRAREGDFLVFLRYTWEITLADNVWRSLRILWRRVSTSHVVLVDVQGSFWRVYSWTTFPLRKWDAAWPTLDSEMVHELLPL